MANRSTRSEKRDHRADRKGAVESALNGVGGDAMLATIKPVTAVLANPNPSNEEVEQAFDAIDAHNPKVMESLGAKFTENWVQGSSDNPAQNLSPVVQVLSATPSKRTTTTSAGSSSLSSSILRSMQNGEKLLDTEYAREAFQRQGGIPTFRYQRELAARDAELTKLGRVITARVLKPRRTTDTAKQPDFNQSRPTSRRQ
jgi:hypothetical protein